MNDGIFVGTMISCVYLCFVLVLTVDCRSIKTKESELEHPGVTGYKNINKHINRQPCANKECEKLRVSEDHGSNNAHHHRGRGTHRRKGARHLPMSNGLALQSDDSNISHNYGWNMDAVVPHGVSRLESKLQPNIRHAAKEFIDNLQSVLVKIREKIGHVDNEYLYIGSNSRDAVMEVRKELEFITKENNNVYDVMLDVSQLVRYIYRRAHENGLSPTAPSHMAAFMASPKIIRVNIEDELLKCQLADRNSTMTYNNVMALKRRGIQQDAAKESVMSKVKDKTLSEKFRYFEMYDLQQKVRLILQKVDTLAGNIILPLRRRLMRYKINQNNVSERVKHAKYLNGLAHESVKVARGTFEVNKKYQQRVHKDKTPAERRQRRSAGLTEEEIIVQRAKRRMQQLDEVAEVIKSKLVPLLAKATVTVKQHQSGGASVLAEIRSIMGKVTTSISKLENKMDEVLSFLNDDKILKARCDELSSTNDRTSLFINCSKYIEFEGSGSGDGIIDDEDKIPSVKHTTHSQDQSTVTTTLKTSTVTSAVAETEHTTIEKSTRSTLDTVNDTTLELSKRTTTLSAVISDSTTSTASHNITFQRSTIVTTSTKLKESLNLTSVSSMQSTTFPTSISTLISKQNITPTPPSTSTTIRAESSEVTSISTTKDTTLKSTSTLPSLTFTTTSPAKPSSTTTSTAKPSSTTTSTAKPSTTTTSTAKPTRTTSTALPSSTTSKDKASTTNSTTKPSLVTTSTATPSSSTTSTATLSTTTIESKPPTSTSIPVSTTSTSKPASTRTQLTTSISEITYKPTTTSTTKPSSTTSTAKPSPTTSTSDPSSTTKGIVQTKETSTTSNTPATIMTITGTTVDIIDGSGNWATDGNLDEGSGLGVTDDDEGSGHIVIDNDLDEVSGDRKNDVHVEINKTGNDDFTFDFDVGSSTLTPTTKQDRITTDEGSAGGANVAEKKVTEKSWWSWFENDDPNVLYDHRQDLKEKLSGLAFQTRLASEDVYNHWSNISVAYKGIQEKWLDISNHLFELGSYVNAAEGLKISWNTIDASFYTKQSLHTAKALDIQRQTDTAQNNSEQAIIIINEKLAKMIEIKQKRLSTNSEKDEGPAFIANLISTVKTVSEQSKQLSNLQKINQSPCQRVQNTASRLRNSIAQLRSKIDKAKTVTSAIPLTFTLDGNDFVKAAVFQQVQSALPTSIIGMCVKPMLENMQIATFYGNATESYSLSLDNLKPIIIVAKEDGTIINTIPFKTALHKAEWNIINFNRTGRTIEMRLSKLNDTSNSITEDSYLANLPAIQNVITGAIIGKTTVSSKAPSFSGCIGDVIVNGKHAALRTDKTSIRLCSASCENKDLSGMVFEGDGFAKFSLYLIDPSYIDNIHLKFQTRQTEGVLLLIKEKFKSLYVVISISDGALHVEVSTRRGTTVLRSNRNKYSDGKNHTIKIVIESDSVKGTTDDPTDKFEPELVRQEVTSGIDDGIFLGGLGVQSHALSGKSKLRAFSGCISSFSISNKDIPLYMVEESKHVFYGNCRENIWQKCVQFYQQSKSLKILEKDDSRRVYVTFSRNSIGPILDFRRIKGEDYYVTIYVESQGTEIIKIKDNKEKKEYKLESAELDKDWHILSVEDNDKNKILIKLGFSSIEVPYTKPWRWFANPPTFDIAVGGLLEDNATMLFQGGISSLIVNDRSFDLQTHIESNNLKNCERISMTHHDSDKTEKPVC